MALLHVPPSVLLAMASKMLGTSHQTEIQQREAYGPTFGGSPEIHSIIWTLLREHCPELFNMRKKMDPERFLWALAKLKVFEKEKVMCGIVARDGKAPCSRSYRDWTWDIIAAIHSLEPYVIDCNWESRGDGPGAPPGGKGMTVDGTDVRTHEEFPFNPHNFSVKFNGPGARFEVALTRSADICKITGPVRPGQYPDDKLFRSRTMPLLDEGETAEGDGIYRMKIPEVFTGDENEDDRQIANARRARHETINYRLKRYGCLSKKFDYGWEKLGHCFRAVAVITQVEMNEGKKLFEIYGVDNITPV